MIPRFLKMNGMVHIYNLKKVQTSPMNKGGSTIKRWFLFMAVWSAKRPQNGQKTDIQTQDFRQEFVESWFLHNC